jgi:hypothetical protein
LQTLTATHTEDIASNTANILTKQATITTSTDIECNSISKEENLNLRKTSFFNTIVIRRFDETDYTPIHLNELQCWVSGSKIFFKDFASNTLVSYFANWENKQVALTALTDGSASNIYNAVIEADYGIHSNEGMINAVIIKYVPLSNINDLQALF